MQIRIWADVTLESRNVEWERDVDERLNWGVTAWVERAGDGGRLSDRVWESEREGEGSVCHSACPSKRALSPASLWGCPHQSRPPGITWPPPPLITYSLLSLPLKYCQFTSLLSFSAELCFCYIKIQQKSAHKHVVFLKSGRNHSSNTSKHFSLF